MLRRSRFRPVLQQVEMQRSPPTTQARTEIQEANLMADMKVYRRLLQKVSKTKTKVLCALREEGCRQAAEMLQTPSREVGATRCNACLGCTTYQMLGPCLRCLPCEREEECIEHSRLCFKWRQPATTYVAGSTVTGVSSACNLAEYDIPRRTRTWWTS